MSYYSKLIHEIERGRLGLNTGLPIGLPKLEKAIGGLQKQRYILIGGFTGSGKTGFVDCAFVINPYAWWYYNRNDTDIKFEGIYRSMERSKTYKLAKWTSIKLYNLTGKLYDVDYLLGIGERENYVSDEIFAAICHFKDFFDEMLDYIDVIDGTMNPTGINKHIRHYYKDKGTFIKSDDKCIYVNGEQVDIFEPEIYEISKKGGKKLFKQVEVSGKFINVYLYSEIFIPYNPNLYTIHYTDHIGKLKKEQGFTKKQTIDKHSEYMGDNRDLYGMTAVDVSQFNRDISDPRRLAANDLAPMLED